MQNLLGYIVFFPFSGFLILALLNRKLPRNLISIIGAGSVGISALLTIMAGINYMGNFPESGIIEVEFWQWFQVGNLDPSFTFLFDPLSLIFIFVITFVGFLIHLYSLEFMAGDEGFARFFAYMNLFIGSMLILVLSNNLVLLYLGWEGVGLCSFLLIGFWYSKPANVRAAKKAFVVTRVGDTLMIIGLFLLFNQFQTLNIREILIELPNQWEAGNPRATWAAVLLLGGAIGKSAQLPLQVWLPDAMAGPSPVSALIHAATMVTAGVYLIARTHVIFLHAPEILTLTALIGGITLLIAGFSALVQYDIKKVLAYSTISQIGYMFLALGVGAWSAAVFHFMIHAFFKALLFLGAGAIILAMHHEHDMFKMGGLRKKMPTAFWTFTAGAVSLAAIPLLTAGFYSKDAILWYSFASEKGSVYLWLFGIIGAFITSLYTFRMIYVTFFGEVNAEPDYKPGYRIKIPLVILAVLSLIAGFIELPHNFADFDPFSEFLHKSLPATLLGTESYLLEWLFQGIGAIASLGGLFLAWYLYIRKPQIPVRLADKYSSFNNFLFKGWGFDDLYRKGVVQPVTYLSEINRHDFIDKIYSIIAGSTILWHKIISKTQNGKVRWYLLGITSGAVLVLAIIILL